MGQQGVAGASASDRAAMELNARAQEARIARTEATKEKERQMETEEGQELDFQMGRLNQVINTYDDYLANMDPNDETQAPYAMSLMRKRDQLAELMNKTRLRGKGAGKGYNSNTLKGILEEGVGNVKDAMFNPETSAQIGRTWNKPKNDQPAEKQKAPEKEKNDESGDSDNFNSSNTVINLD